jgi:endonuclease III
VKLPSEPPQLVPHRAKRPQPVTNENIGSVLSAVKKEVRQHDLPIVTLVGQMGRDPFKVLMATMLSLRTKDQVTAQAAERLFAVAITPAQMLTIPEAKLAQLIYPVGFYKTKAKAIRAACEILIDRYNGQVPPEIDELVTLPGVGRKTANLVLTEGFRKHAICVDTHVHRISNIWGYVQTKTPEHTEMALREKLPRRYWLGYNDLLVSFGQHRCVPVSPKCTGCPVFAQCPRIGVVRSR